MSDTIARARPATPPRERGDDRFPALCRMTVRRVAGPRLLVEGEGARTWAVLALPVPYRPEVGDTVLVIAQAGTAYVIGVLAGSGATTLSCPGDLVLEAAGSVRVRGGTGIELEAPEVRVHARVLRTVVECVRERLGSVFRVVRSALRTRAGEVREDVQGDHRTRAGRIFGKARKGVRIDGESIHLG